MRGHVIKSWTEIDLALLIGLYAMGKDFEFIARKLNCTRGEAMGMIESWRAVRKLGQGPASLLRRRMAAPIEETDQIDPMAGGAIGSRRYRAKSSASNIRASIGPDVTAQLMGDPDPDRRARIASKEV
ncbi:hypothetical protein J0X15_12355 [Roseibium sp. CAU 1637]|uniref:Uncharacterized protein n=1 Tax=Roseibium limicola TaxID=2816037 RepID=A0A939EP49_9HYPH|nr:hypothetical protein [Roseibium limicola]MBO0346017.1 hypothetical protein [Roseibium limicola]